MLITIKIQYSCFYSNARQNYLYFGLRNGIKMAKNKMTRNIINYFTHKRCKNFWCHMKLFRVEHNHWTLFHHMYASIPDKIQQKIISKVRLGLGLWCLKPFSTIIHLSILIIIDITCTFAVIWFVLFMLLKYLYGEGLVLVSCKNLFPIQLYRYWQ
jgi:hypothetical protein